MAGSVQDDIRRFQLEINTSKNNGETLSQLTKLEKETSKLRHENEELQKVMAHLASTGRKGSDEYKRMDSQLKLNRKTIRQNADEMKGLQKNLDLNYMSMGQLRKRSIQLKSTLSGMSKAANPAEYDRLEKELGQVGMQMDKLNGKSVKVKSGMGNLMSAAKGMLPAFGWTAIIAGAIALGKKFFELTRDTFKLRAEVEQLTGKTGAEMIKLTTQIQGAARTFKEDTSEMALANNAFSKSMDEPHEKMQELINKGFIAGANRGGEFIDKLKEYGPQFKAAGVEAETAIAIMTQEVTSGIFSDKGTDAIKEGMLRLREMPKATQEALEGIGISSEEMMNQLSSGEITAFEAMQKVSRKLDEFPEQSTEVGTAIADIFGGAGEDAGIEYIKMLADVETNMDTLIAKSGESAAQQKMLLDSNIELTQEWNSLLGDSSNTFASINTTVKILMNDGLIGLMKGFKELKSWFVDFYNKAALLRGYIQGYGLVFKVQFRVIKTAILEVINYWKTFGNVIKAVLTGEFGEGQIKNIIAKGFEEGKEIAMKAGEEIATDAVNAWDKTVNGKIVLKPKIETGDIDSKEVEKKVAKAIKPTVPYKKQVVLEFIKGDEINDSYLNDAETEEELKTLAALQKKKDNLLKKYQTQSLAELHNEEMLILQQAYDNKLLTEEQFQQAKADIQLNYQQMEADKTRENFDGKLADFQRYIAQFAFIAQGATNIALGLQDLEFEELETKRQQGLISEEDYKKEQISIRKKYADMEFVAQIAQIITSTAAGVMQSFAMFGPVLGSALAALPTAAGAIQVGVANKQRQRVKSMYDGGFSGFTSPGGKYEERELTQLHGSEYVIPKEGVENPTIRPFIDFIESKRVSRNLTRVNMPIATSMYKGGYVDNQSLQNSDYDSTNSLNKNATTQDTTAYDMAMTAIKQSNALYEKLMSDGVLAHYGDEETRSIQERMDEETIIRERAKIR